MSANAIDVRALYTEVGRALPLEGRDFAIDISYVSEVPVVRVIPLTEMGRAWAPFLVKELRNAHLSQDDVDIVIYGTLSADCKNENEIESKQKAELAERHKVLLGNNKE